MIIDSKQEAFASAQENLNRLFKKRELSYSGIVLGKANHYNTVNSSHIKDTT